MIDWLLWESFDAASYMLGIILGIITGALGNRIVLTATAVGKFAGKWARRCKL